MRLRHGWIDGVNDERINVDEATEHARDTRERGMNEFDLSVIRFIVNSRA